MLSIEKIEALDNQKDYILSDINRFPLSLVYLLSGIFQFDTGLLLPVRVSCSECQTSQLKILAQISISSLKGVAGYI